LKIQFLESPQVSNCLGFNRLLEFIVIFDADNASNVVKMGNDLQEEDLISEHHRCSCHTLHLCVTHALNIPAVAPLLSKAKTIVNTIRRSNLCTQTLLDQQQSEHKVGFDAEEEDEDKESRPLKLLIDCATRWSSVYIMLQRLFKLKSAVDATLHIHGHDDKILSATEWTDIQQLVQLLKPIADVVRTLEGDQYPTLSLSWQMILAVSRYLRGRTLQFPQYPDWQSAPYGHVVNVVRHALLEEIGKPDRFRQPTAAMKIAATLDPRRKSLEFLLTAAERDAAFNLLLEKLRVEFPDLHPEPAPVRDEMDLDLLAPPVAPDAVDVLALEVTRYRSTPECDGKQELPLVWWKRHSTIFPHISRLARRYLALPASSAPSERVFSRLNVTVTARRASLLPEKVERLILVHENRKLML